MEKRELICIGCPLGCQMVVELEDGIVSSVTGNGCNIGKKHAQEECINPTRVVTTTVKVECGQYPLTSVKTKKAVAKDKIKDCMHQIKSLSVEAPIMIGDVLIKDVASTGIEVIATREVQRIV